MNEHNQVHPFLEQLFEPFFKVDHEFATRIEGNRIDFILQLDGLRFGVEAKNTERKKGSDFTQVIKQGYRYTQAYKIPIFIYPSISDCFDQHDVPHHIYHPHSNINSILSLYKIGEVRRVFPDWRYNDNKGYAFIFNNKIIWHEQTGINIKNYQYYEQKLFS
jgi:hypothetical protein